VKPAAVLLAGGSARRMGGGDKSLHTLAGRPILDHVIDRIRPQVSAIALNANGDPTRFARWRLPVIADLIPSKPGPLAGIQAGMAWVRERYPGISHIISVPTDLPFLPADLVGGLETALRDADADIAVASSMGQAHPVVALWPADLADELLRAVADEGVRKVTEFAARYRVVDVDFPVTGPDPFFNINNPDDLQQAQSLT
jgi:molybdopterin-guanine dinucleotide biosynthesis protein A